MGNRVLIAYATKYGATGEIAEKIGAALRRKGLEVDILNVKNVKDLKPYNAVIVGTAAYMFRWRPEAVSFLNKHKKLLASLPVWLFSSGPLGKGDPVQLSKGERFPKSVQSVVETIKPRDVAVFHGYINMQKLNFFERFAFKKAVEMQGDFRDWNAIEAWANKIADVLNR
jgi:menaquinone-dependent protoporphyrinogen oxidase